MADELDRLYWVAPEDFTAERAKLAAAARKGGDAAAARRISAARKPTVAAWIVNRLALQHKDTPKRLADLGDRLRAAHADLDGARIRDLSAEQHQLISELTLAALEAAGVDNLSATMRDDLTGTLQAAIADPEVRGRLGRLTRPERWAGFGSFGDAAPAAPAPARDRAEGRRKELTAALAAAEHAKSEANARLSRREAERDAARRRRDEARAALRAAERELDSAEEEYASATRVSRSAAESVERAKAQLGRV